MTDSIEITQQWFSVDQIAKHLGINRRTVAAWIHHGADDIGQLEALRLGGQYRISKAAVENFLARARAARVGSEYNEAEWKAAREMLGEPSA